MFIIKKDYLILFYYKDLLKNIWIMLVIELKIQSY